MTTPKRCAANAQHRMLELGLTMTDLASVLGKTRQTLHDKLLRMTPRTRELLRVLLVLPVGALEEPTPAIVCTYPAPDMGAWHACMTQILKEGQPYPDTDALFTLCRAYAAERERGTLLDPTEV